MKKTKLFMLGMLLLLSFSFIGCSNKTECEQKGHSWCQATCEKAKHCTICGTTEGESLGHNWVDATCEKAKHCTICGTTEGEALGHNWVDATCEEAKHCTTCSTTVGEALGHNWVDATCEEAKHCTTCGTTEGEALGHNWVDATCEECEKCSECGYVRNDKLAEHKIIEATYLQPSYCEVCQKEFGERLVCYPKMIEAKWNSNERFITNEQYNNIEKYLQVYGILEDQTKVELSIKDIEFRQERLESDSKCHLILSYNGVECVTDKVLLGTLEEIPLDFNKLDVDEYQMIATSDSFAKIGVNYDSLKEYISNAGYTDISDYFTSKGLKNPKISKRYTPLASITFLPIHYYVKDNYCIYVSPAESIFDSKNTYVMIYVYQMPDNFVKLGLDKLLSDNIYDLFYTVEKRSSFCIGEVRDPILYLDYQTTTVSLEYFSKVEKEQLVHNIEKFYGSSYVTYEREGDSGTYLHFTGNDKFDIVIKITSTVDDYFDIEVSLIEK